MSALFMVLAACRTEPKEAPTAPAVPSASKGDEVIRAVADVANRVSADPAALPQALADHGLTEEELVKLLYQIAERDTRTADYLSARRAP